MFLTVLLVVVQVRFHHTEQSTTEVVAQLRFLRDELRGGAGERMQELFPEGYVFSHVLYGLTWTDVARQAPASKDEALREARWALRRLDSADGRAPLEPPRGSFAPVVPWWWRLPWLASTSALLALLWWPVARGILRDRHGRMPARAVES